MVYFDDDATSYKNQGNKEHDCDYSSKTSLKHQKPLTTNGKIVLITHTIALLTIIVLEIAGYATPEWVIGRAAGGVETTYGLWQSCKDSPTMKKMCVSTEWGKLKGYHMAGFAFMSMSLMIAFLGCSLVLIFYCIKDQAHSKHDLCCRPVVKLKMTVTLLFCSSTMLGVAAVGFFCSTYIKGGPNSMAMKLGYSSILILVGSVLTIPVLIGLLYGVTYHRVRGGGKGGDGGFAKGGRYRSNVYGGGVHGDGEGGHCVYPPLTPVAMMMPRTPVLNCPTTPGYYPY